MDSGFEQATAGTPPRNLEAETSFLGGWGGALAFFLGFGVASAMAGAVTFLLRNVDVAVSSAGLSVHLRVVVLYWAQTVISIACLVLVFLGLNRFLARLQELRAGRGGRSDVAHLALGIGLYWMALEPVFSYPAGLAQACDAYAETVGWWPRPVALGVLGALWLARRGLSAGRKQASSRPS